MRRLAWLIGLALAGPLPAQSAPPGRPILPSLPATVRSAGLSGSSVALIGYAGSLFTNPSGLAPIGSLSIEGALARRAGRSSYVMGAAAGRVGSFNLGAGYQYVRLADGGAIRSNRSVAGALVYRFMGLAIGGAGRYMEEEPTVGETAASLSGDLGLTLAFFDIAALAVTVQNVASTGVDGPGVVLPTTTHLGFSMNLIDTYSNGRLLATVEMVWTEGAPRRTILGLEAGVVVGGVGLVGRIGTGAQAGGTGLSETNFGGAVVLGRAALDYAYQKRSALGEQLHLFGIRWTP